MLARRCWLLIHRVLVVAVCVISLAACNSGGSASGVVAGGAAVSTSAADVSLGSLPNGSVVVSSLGSFTLPSGSTIAGIVGIADGQPGYSGELTLSVRNTDPTEADAALPIITTSPNPCVLVSGNSSQSNCQILIRGQPSVPGGTFAITPTFTPQTGNAMVLNDIPVVNSAIAKVTPGSLSITLGSSSIVDGASTTATISLSGSSGVSGLPVTLLTNNVPNSGSKILSLSATKCTLSSTARCTVTIKGLATGVATLVVSATNYSTVVSKDISVNPVVIPGNLTLHLANASITSGQTTTATVSLIGSSNVTGLAVTLSSTNSGIASISNTPACNLSSTVSSCNVVVTASANVMSATSTTLKAGASGYTTAQATVSVNPVPVAGTLSIALGTSNINVGKSTIAKVTLTGSTEVSGLTINFTSSNSNAVLISPKSCSVSTGSNTCSVSITAESVGLFTITASANGYASSQIALTTSLAPVPGTISIALANTYLSYGQSESATVTLSGSSGVSSVAVGITSDNTGMATVSPSSCTLSSTNTSCNVKVSSGTTLSGSTYIVATASGYTASQAGISVADALAVPNESAYMQVYVTPSVGSTTCGYQNAPCVTLTICNPSATSDCVTINNILLDSGSYGLRVFSSLVSVLNLPVEKQGNNTVAECVEYADDSSNWGPVASANIRLTSSGITASNAPIQLINSSYVGAANCTGAASNPAQFGLNGILGVGPLINDDGYYFACNGSSCSQINLAVDEQVSNPIGLLSNSNYNNGVTIKFPYIGTSGGSGVIGYAIFGVGTDSDNMVSSGVNKYPITLGGDIPIVMPTNFNSSSLDGFLDTGSNGLFFNGGSNTTCDGGWYCPSGTLSLAAQNRDSSGSWITTDFNIENANTLFITGNGALNGLGAPLIAGYFDYGLPFFFGKTVYIGFDGMVSPSMGTGPYWGF